MTKPGDLIDKRVKWSAMKSNDPNDEWGTGTEEFRVVVAKEGYVTLVRQFTASGSVCSVNQADGAFPGPLGIELRMVKGPPGNDDVYRKAR